MPSAFYDPGRFPFIAAVEAAYPQIRRELDALRFEDFFQWPEISATNDPGWTIGGWYGYPILDDDYKHWRWLYDIDEKRARCPVTCRVAAAIPGITNLGFSALLPRTHILPHCGEQSHLLRCHMGLRIPDGAVIRVGNESAKWQEGKCIVFDDTREHEVWNNHPLGIRVVMLWSVERRLYGIPNASPSRAGRVGEAGEGTVD